MVVFYSKIYNYLVAKGVFKKQSSVAKAAFPSSAVSLTMAGDFFEALSLPVYTHSMIIDLRYEMSYQSFLSV